MRQRDILAYFLTGLVLGVGLGISLGVLVAPDRGERTRKKWFKRAERLRDNLAERISPN